MGRGPSIEGRKNAEDARRGKIFTKIIREISVAARAAGGEPANNPRLRVAVDKALSANMHRNAAPATNFFRIPGNRLVELGAQVEI